MTKNASIKLRQLHLDETPITTNTRRAFRISSQHPLRTQASSYPALMPLYIRSSHRRSSGSFAPDWQRGGRIEDSPTPRQDQWEKLLSLLPRLTEQQSACVRACALRGGVDSNYPVPLFIYATAWPSMWEPMFNSTPHAPPSLTNNNNNRFRRTGSLFRLELKLVSLGRFGASH